MFLGPRVKSWFVASSKAPVPLPPIAVLVIDDDEKVVTRVQEVLRRAGCLVDTAGSGPEGLARVARQDYDLVFTDLMMPEMDGIGGVRRGRGGRPQDGG